MVEPVIEPRKHAEKCVFGVFCSPTSYSVDFSGNDPQKPPETASPEPRLKTLGATKGFGAARVKSKMRNAPIKLIVMEAAINLVMLCFQPQSRTNKDPKV